MMTVACFVTKGISAFERIGSILPKIVNEVQYISPEKYSLQLY